MPLEGEYEPSSSAVGARPGGAIESSGGTEATTLRGVPVIVVTSMGAKSGKLRKNPVMRVEHDGGYAAVASKGGAPEHPVWYRNLVEHPLVEVQDGTVKGDYRARELKRRERELGGSGPSRSGPTTPSTRPRPIGRSRSSCSSRRNEPGAASRTESRRPQLAGQSLGLTAPRGVAVGIFEQAANLLTELGRSLGGRRRTATAWAVAAASTSSSSPMMVKEQLLSLSKRRQSAILRAMVVPSSNVIAQARRLLLASGNGV